MRSFLLTSAVCLPLKPLCDRGSTMSGTWPLHRQGTADNLLAAVPLVPLAPFLPRFKVAPATEPSIICIPKQLKQKTFKIDDNNG
jgi:hypothetical protein